jgi:hypothetical protein
MGNLKAKAKRELEDDHQAEQRRREDKERKAQERHAERVRPAAEFLSKWADETVTAEKLKDVSSPTGGPSIYEVKVDGFTLRLRVSGGTGGSLSKPTVIVFQVRARKGKDPEEREVDRPADLLADWPRKA